MAVECSDPGAWRRDIQRRTGRVPRPECGTGTRVRGETRGPPGGADRIWKGDIRRTSPEFPGRRKRPIPYAESGDLIFNRKEFCPCIELTED